MRPRLTARVVRGFGNILSTCDTEGLTDERSSDGYAAIIWMREMIRWKASPRRKGSVPPQLAKLMKKRRRRAR